MWRKTAWHRFDLRHSDVVRNEPTTGRAISAASTRPASRAMAEGGRDMMILKGRTALITGSTDGVGRLVAGKLGSAGARVLVHGRDQDRGQRVATEIRAAGGTAEFLAADLASLADVRRLADTIRRNEPRLDILVNNAGIGTAGTARLTSADGYELRFAVNYLAGFLLTHLLLPLIRQSAPARIVNVASAGQQAIDFDDVMLTHGFSGRRAYCQSKLAQIMFTVDLAQELAGSNVAVNALHPATYMDTAMVRRAGVTPVSTVEEGAAAILNLAVSPASEDRSGRYFIGLNEGRAHAQAHDNAARQRLRAISLALTGLAEETS
jgi:NAD(P)-dependent dehydrogenase (short-subunit alcohol dehydrogenase family)